MTILIVDDHPIVRKGIHALLAASFADADITDAASLKEAEDLCASHHVDIMITDLDLNGESGLTLIRRVRDILPRSKATAVSPTISPNWRCARST